jgi:hypothetical protein
MKRWKWVILIFELVLCSLILVLPQVDLPDFAFHGGTAPVTARARLNSTPAASSGILLARRVSLPGPAVEAQIESHVVPVLPVAESRLSLFCTLLC